MGGKDFDNRSHPQSSDTNLPPDSNDTNPPPDADLPSHWEVLTSTSKGLPYYFNKATKKSQWDRPVRCAHLLVKHEGSRRPSSWRESEITRTKNDALSSISEYKSSIRVGETTLETLASKMSDCSSARKKGDLGYFGRGEMQEAFESAAYSLKVGEMSDVIETESGLHLIKRLG